jgi:hypothetical protein
MTKVSRHRTYGRTPEWRIIACLVWPDWQTTKSDGLPRIAAKPQPKKAFPMS